MMAPSDPERAPARARGCPGACRDGIALAISRLGLRLRARSGKSVLGGEASCGLVRAGEGAGSGGRDLRVDVFRGLALWFIFIDHVPGNLLGGFTLRNIALCDATEAFVLLAGYAAGIAYGAHVDRQGWLFAAASLLRRAGTLYIAHIFLFVVLTAQVGYSAAALDSAAYLDELHLDAFGEQPYRALLEALLLRFQPAFLDILPLYIVLLLMLIPACRCCSGRGCCSGSRWRLRRRAARRREPAELDRRRLVPQPAGVAGAVLHRLRPRRLPPGGGAGRRSRARAPAPVCARCSRWAPRWWSPGSGPSPCPTCRIGSASVLIRGGQDRTAPASGCCPSWRSPTCWAMGDRDAAWLRGRLARPSC